MRIQCGRAQTGFNPVQCALSAQCGQALSVRGDIVILVSLKNCTTTVFHYYKCSECVVSLLPT